MTPGFVAYFVLFTTIVVCFFILKYYAQTVNLFNLLLFEEHPAMSRKFATKSDPGIIRETAESNVFFMCFDLR